MKKIDVFLVLFSFFSPLYASQRTSLMQEGAFLQVPALTYDMLKEKGLLDRNWGPLEIEGESWHVHWSLEKRPSIEKLFSPEAFAFRIVCLDTSRLGESNHIDTKFATFEILPIPRSGAKEQKKEGIQASIFYTFFLSKAERCYISHN